jgi:signal transduction histidine kinase/CheY-like chemotaxis protein
MMSQQLAETMNESDALSGWLQKLQEDALSFALLGLATVGMIILGTLDRFRTSFQTLLITAVIFMLVGVIWKLRQWHFLIAAGFLILSTIALNVYVAIITDLDLAFILLAIPVGFATLVVSRAAGALTATLCTAGLLFSSRALLALDPALLVITLLMVWSTFAMLWLTLNPLLTAVRWAWSSHEQSHALLEEARNTQVRLHETLEDLLDANLQLTRLNRQAQGLRQVAEDERRAKQEFVANVSHELRTPLNMIVGFCEMMTKSPESYGDVPPALLSDLEVVLRNGQHLANLVEDVLDLSQIEAGRMALTKEPVELPELIQAAAVAVRPLFESKGLSLETDVLNSIPSIFCDRTRVREVLLNLLSNAGRFTEEGGVFVRAWCEDANVVVSVQDTGPGIAERDQKRLFRPFEQVDSSLRRRYGGTGLGLSISKSFVELHAGRLWLESHPGSGTTFFFSLPLESPESLESPPTRWITPGWEFLQRTHPVRRPPSILRRRVLVIEEGHILQRLLERYMTDSEVAAVHDLEHAYDLLAHTPAQAVVINTSHPAATLQRLNEGGSVLYDVPVLLCTIPGVEQAADGLGVEGYLVKPISQLTLLEALDGLRREIKTILVVDDEPEALRLFRRMLIAAKRDYRVVRADNGQQAWRILQQEPVDVILLDLMMPEMNGFELLALKNDCEDLAGIPVILTSARDPLGQPIVSNALVITRPHGLSGREILTCIETMIQLLSPADYGGRCGE